MIDEPSPGHVQESAVFEEEDTCCPVQLAVKAHDGKVLQLQVAADHAAGRQFKLVFQILGFKNV